ncbi:hypothetical protein [Rhodobium gokarnense]|uniref:Uncharacterized protein n=1 Tax=Rhodobium gokarnense TaxID=364296 RepID=A0ABT3HH22_9HYPH|nr:hypothetical protein [Rhodobium gokarnense]MCW2309705.1 hypothetical protein [Rhodobium gokarnense]
MTFLEFKAWFDGFCEGIEGAPNTEQWKRICEKFGEVHEPLPGPCPQPYRFVPGDMSPFGPPYEITCSLPAFNLDLN